MRAHKPVSGKVRAFVETIDRTRLLAAIDPTTKNKLDPVIAGTYKMTLPAASDYDFTIHSHTGVFEGIHEVNVIKAIRQGKPRIFVKCACGRSVPFGRVNQHSHDEKYGSVMLRTSKGEFITIADSMDKAIETNLSYSDEEWEKLCAE